MRRLIGQTFSFRHFNLTWNGMHDLNLVADKSVCVIATNRFRPGRNENRIEWHLFSSSAKQTRWKCVFSFQINFSVKTALLSAAYLQYTLHNIQHVEETSELSQYVSVYLLIFFKSFTRLTTHTNSCMYWIFILTSVFHKNSKNNVNNNKANDMCHRRFRYWYRWWYAV